jgi:hypothetical protein
MGDQPPSRHRPVTLQLRILRSSHSFPNLRVLTILSTSISSAHIIRLRRIPVLLASSITSLMARICFRDFFCFSLHAGLFLTDILYFVLLVWLELGVCLGSLRFRYQVFLRPAVGMCALGGFLSAFPVPTRSQPAKAFSPIGPCPNLELRLTKILYACVLV